MGGGRLRFGMAVRGCGMRVIRSGGSGGGMLSGFGGGAWICRGFFRGGGYVGLSCM